MPETAKKVIKARTESHSDVANSKPAKELQRVHTERQFGDQVLYFLRETDATIQLRNFKDEWVETDEGMVHEISIEAQPLE